MKLKSSQWTMLLAGTIASVVCSTSTNAQSVDALLDKLVDKGVLSTTEAKELREEADRGFTKAYQGKSGLPDWVTSLKISGDFRGRIEGFNFDNDAFTDRLRYRYRLRFGAVAVLKENFEVGFRLTSSDSPSGFGTGDPISGNSTLQDNGSKKNIFVDLAYGRWTPLHAHGFSDTITIGKMENPFLVSDLVYDSDYTPEGIGNTFGYDLNQQHGFRLNLGAFILDEIGANARDPYLLGAQVRWDGKWSPTFQTTMGLAAFSISNTENLGNAAVPNQNAGNTRNAAGILDANFNPVVVDASATYMVERVPLNKGPFPIKIHGEALNNPGADSKNSAWMVGVGFGRASKKGTWAVDYRYKYLEANSWYEELPDSDFGALYAVAPAGSGRAAGYAAGTNLKGHVIRVAYAPHDAVVLQFTYFLTELVDNPAPSSSDTGRFQVDMSWKF